MNRNKHFKKRVEVLAGWILPGLDEIEVKFNQIEDDDDAYDYLCLALTPLLRHIQAIEHCIKHEDAKKLPSNLYAIWLEALRKFDSLKATHPVDKLRDAAERVGQVYINLTDCANNLRAIR